MSKTLSSPTQESLWPIMLPIGSQRHMPAFPVQGTVWLFGAQPHAHILLKSKLVSRSHALIVNDRNESYIRDLSSTNGIFLNNVPTRETRVENGDILNIGRFQFICYNGFPSELDEEVEETPQPSDADLLIEGYDKHVPIHLRTLVIGRREHCEVKLDDPQVSSVHAVIYRCDGRRRIRDLSSLRGTYLNHQRIRDAELIYGDMIRVGDTIIHYDLDETCQREGWVPASAAEVEQPLRIADEDDAAMDPMTDSSLEKALMAAREADAAADAAAIAASAGAPPQENPSEMLKPCVVLTAPASERRLVRSLKGQLDNFADTISMVEAEAQAGEVIAALRPAMGHGGPTPKNVDRPIPAKSSKKKSSKSRRTIEMEVEQSIKAGAHVTPDEAADLLEDGFFRESGMK
jgi:pSer/pThr/pTyr-binding forkhead associated (FHA) protein